MKTFPNTKLSFRITEIQAIEWVLKVEWKAEETKHAKLKRNFLFGATANWEGFSQNQAKSIEIAVFQAVEWLLKV